MTPEIYWLIWSALLTAFLWIPYGSYRISKIGFGRLLMDPLPGDDPFDDAWAHRAYRVHMNAFETIATFAPVAIAVHVTGSGNEVTAAAAAIYFWLRLVYIPVYIFKVPVLRLVLFLVALFATAVMAFQMIG
mgnify:CR=1 FL=1